MEQKYGSKPNADGSESTDSEDESDAPPEVSEEVETQFLKTLALLKTKDPRIYDPEFKFFDGSEKKEPGKYEPRVFRKLVNIVCKMMMMIFVDKLFRILCKMLLNFILILAISQLGF